MIRKRSSSGKQSIKDFCTSKSGFRQNKEISCSLFAVRTSPSTAQKRPPTRNEEHKILERKRPRFRQFRIWLCRRPRLHKKRDMNPRTHGNEPELSEPRWQQRGYKQTPRLVEQETKKQFETQRRRDAEKKIRREQNKARTTTTMKQIEPKLNVMPVQPAV